MCEIWRYRFAVDPRRWYGLSHWEEGPHRRTEVPMLRASMTLRGQTDVYRWHNER